MYASQSKLSKELINGTEAFVGQAVCNKLWINIVLTNNSWTPWPNLSFNAIFGLLQFTLYAYIIFFKFQTW